jgi:hypothetical protein
LARALLQRRAKLIQPVTVTILQIGKASLSKPNA